jgi:hypothetical protein
MYNRFCDFLIRTEKNPNFKYKVILGDGSCILNFTPETFACVDPQPVTLPA